MKRQINPIPIPKPTPRRLLNDGDIIFVKKYTTDLTSMKPHYFMVVSAGEQQTKDGHKYDIACLHMGSMHDPDKQPWFREKALSYPSNMEVRGEVMVWYNDTNMSDYHKNSDAIVKTDRLYLFDSKTLDYEHRGELLYEDTFEEDAIKAHVSPKGQSVLNKRISYAEQLYENVWAKLRANIEAQKDLAKYGSKYNKYTNNPHFSYVIENLPDYQKVHTKTPRRQLNPSLSVVEPTAMQLGD